MDDYIAFKIRTEDAKKVVLAYVEAKGNEKYDRFMNDDIIVRFFDSMSRLILKKENGG
jgi:hypothetical protein